MLMSAFSALIPVNSVFKFTALIMYLSSYPFSSFLSCHSTIPAHCLVLKYLLTNEFFAFKKDHLQLNAKAKAG